MAIISKKLKPSNAIKHGAFSHQVLLHGEHQKDLDLLIDSVFEEWKPEGVSEEKLALNLASLYWKKQRLERYYQIATAKILENIHEQNLLIEFYNELSEMAPEFQAAGSVAEVEALLADLSAVEVRVIRTNCPPHAANPEDSWGRLIASYLIQAGNKPLIKGSSKFMGAVSPDALDNELSRFDRIEATIERCIKSLVQIKTAKHMLPQAPRIIGSNNLKIVNDVNAQ